MFRGSRYQHCRKCGRKTQWVKCPNCNGKGTGLMTTCGNNCDAGYKCEKGTRDKWHR